MLDKILVVLDLVCAILNLIVIILFIREHKSKDEE